MCSFGWTLRGRTCECLRFQQPVPGDRSRHEARVIKVDKVERRIGLSVKAAEYSEEELKKETAAFDALRPSADLVGLEQAFNLATEDWSPSGTDEEAAEGEEKAKD